jgi:hypothetical protein
MSPESRLRLLFQRVGGGASRYETGLSNYRLEQKRGKRRLLSLSSVRDDPVIGYEVKVSAWFKLWSCATAFVSCALIRVVPRVNSFSSLFWGQEGFLRFIIIYTNK